MTRKRYKDEIGNKYGYLVVTALSHIDGYRVYWKAICHCGNETVVRSDSLRNGSCKSCKKCDIQKRPAWDSIYKRGFQILKNGAKSRGLIVEIDLEDFITFSQMPCHWCGKPPYDKRYLYSRRRYSRGEDADEFAYMSGIDRIDSALGYTLTNSVSCCTMCNKMKTDFSAEEFLRKVVEIYEHRTKNGNSSSSSRNSVN